jgi:hypothetical protein
MGGREAEVFMGIAVKAKRQDRQALAFLVSPLVNTAEDQRR